MTELNSLVQFEIKYNYETSAYEFTTDDGILYIITFLDYSDVIGTEYPVYAFGIERFPPHGKCKSSNAVRNTILNILERFFQRNDNAMVAIYDSSDKRQMCRKRLFDKWFSEFDDGTLSKLDGSFDIDGETNFAMALYSSTHPFRQELEHHFRMLLDVNFYN
ncbi:DUF6169 family protein [Prevotella dentasini]|uniref:DUF6169 family protein n=1 Tax=Prevotella dentasini TaxID=589537 RepID=UPI000469AA09|nr:DUF6169 family protein [Prevotella dentasini]